MDAKVAEEAIARSVNPERMAQSVKLVQEVLAEVATKAEQAGVTQIDAATGQLRRFYKRNDFGMPHVFRNTEQFIKPGKIRDEALEVLQTMHGKSRRDAENILQKIHDRSLLEISEGNAHMGYSNLMGRRYNLPGFEDDPAAILPTYFGRMAQKIENAKAFGGETLPGNTGIEAAFPKAFAEVNTIANSVKRNTAKNIIRRQLGAVDPGNKFIQRIMPFQQAQAVMKLGTSQITQLTQFAASTIQPGYRDSFKNLLRLFSKDPLLHDAGIRSGAFMESLTRASIEQVAGSAGRRTTQSLRRSGFTWMDTTARRLGVLQGFSMASYASQQLTTLVRRLPEAGRLETKFINREIVKIERKLTTLGLDSKKIVERGGILTQEESLLAGQTISTNANFWTDALSLPEFWKSPEGRVLFQFKSFIFQWGRFINQAAVQPLVQHGEWGPMLRMLAAAQVSGEVVNDLQSIVRAKPRDKQGMARIIDNFAQGGSFAIVADAIRATNYEGGLWSFGLGPSADDVENIVHGAIDLATGRGPRRIVKKAVGMGVPFIPFVGPVIAPAVTNILFPPKRRRKK